MNASLRWYYANRIRVLARAAVRAKLPGFNEKRRLYKARLRERLLSLRILVPGKPGRPKKSHYDLARFFGTGHNDDEFCTGLNLDLDGILEILAPFFSLEV